MRELGAPDVEELNSHVKIQREKCEELLKTGNIELLISCFSWSDTPQGFNYWKKITSVRQN